jgi:hypothetical protein
VSKCNGGKPIRMRLKKDLTRYQHSEGGRALHHYAERQAIHLGQ